MIYVGYTERMQMTQLMIATAGDSCSRKNRRDRSRATRETTSAEERWMRARWQEACTLMLQEPRKEENCSVQRPLCVLYCNTMQESQFASVSSGSSARLHLKTTRKFVVSYLRFLTRNVGPHLNSSLAGYVTTHIRSCHHNPHCTSKLQHTY